LAFFITKKAIDNGTTNNLNPMDVCVNYTTVRALKQSIKTKRNNMKEPNKKYEIEIASTTYRTYDIDAESEDVAIDKAFELIDVDSEISREWKDGAVLSYCEELVELQFKRNERI
jgi:hypothetical protein